MNYSRIYRNAYQRGILKPTLQGLSGLNRELVVGCQALYYLKQQPMSSIELSEKMTLSLSTTLNILKGLSDNALVKTNDGIFSSCV